MPVANREKAVAASLRGFVPALIAIHLFHLYLPNSSKVLISSRIITMWSPLVHSLLEKRVEQA
jgi:hypothetical protein